MIATHNTWMKSLISRAGMVVAAKSKAGRRLPQRSRGRSPLVEPLENRCLLSGVLGTAADFAVLGASTVTNTGATIITGNVGVSPGTAITGFPPGVVNGTIHAGDAVAATAHADLVTAYGDIAGEASPPANDKTNVDLGGLTLLPGVYHFDTAATMSGILTLDAQGDPNARFDFQIGTTLITGGNSAVHLINGGQADNVYFQVGTSATLGTNTAFEGNILADQSVTLTTGASMLEGRALALVGAVTMDTNLISAAEADISVTNTTAAGPVLAGDTLTYTITVANTGPNDAQTLALSDLVPANTTFVSDAQTSGPAFTLTNPAIGGTGTISGTISTLALGASATFNVVVLVSPRTPAGTTIANTADVSSDTSDPNLANNTATVTKLVATQADVALTETTTAGPVLAGHTVTYTTTISNAGPSDAQNVAMTDLVPANTTFVSDAQTSGPAFTVTNPATGGTGTISGTIGTLAFGASASFTVVVLVSPSTPDGTTISNTADVTAATNDPNLANNSGTDTTLVATQADVSATETTAAGPVVAGSTITYTTTISNAGPSDAQTATLSDAVPAGTTFVSDTQTSGPAFTLTNPSVGGTGSISGTINTLASGASASFTVIVQVSPSTLNGATITNTATVNSATGDPNLANNNQTVMTGVLVAAPTVTGLSPTQGSIAGGTLVTLTGTNLENATEVDFGSTAITSFSSDSATQIVLVSPAGSAGPVDVTVFTSGGTSATSPSDRFTYVTAPTMNQAPTITSPAAATFTVNQAMTFTVHTAGFPIAALSETGALPVGVTFTDNHDGTATISGTPVANSDGTYHLTFVAANDVLPSASQAFTLTVNPASTNPPVITVNAYFEGISATSNTGTLHAVAEQNGTDANLTYTWSIISQPTPLSGGPLAIFSLNGTHSTKNTSVTFMASGQYTLQVVASNGTQSAASQVQVTVHVKTAVARATTQATQVSGVQTLGDARSITGFVVTFNGPVDPTTAQDVRGYRILWQNTVSKGQSFWQTVFGWSAGTRTQNGAYKIASAVYDSQTDSVTLTLASPMPVQNGVRLIKVMGTGPNAVLDANLKPIDGDGNDKPGGNFTDRFSMSVAKNVTYQTTAGDTVKLSLSGPGEIVTLLPSGTKTPVIDLIDTDSADSILTGKYHRGRKGLGYVVLDQLNGTANANIQLGVEFHVNQSSPTAAV